MSPCCTRLYPSAEMRAWASRESNSTARISVVDVEVRVVSAFHGGTQADIAGELHLVGLDRDLPVRVVEDQTDLARVGALLVLPAVPDEVRQFSRADRLGALRAEDEQDRVRDVALAEPFGPVMDVYPCRKGTEIFRPNDLKFSIWISFRNKVSPDRWKVSAEGCHYYPSHLYPSGVRRWSDGTRKAIMAIKV